MISFVQDKHSIEVKEDLIPTINAECIVSIVGLAILAGGIFFLATANNHHIFPMLSDPVSGHQRILTSQMLGAIAATCLVVGSSLFLIGVIQWNHNKIEMRKLEEKQAQAKLTSN